MVKFIIIIFIIIIIIFFEIVLLRNFLFLLIIITVNILHIWLLFTLAFADGFPVEWQQVSSSLQGSSQYSSRS